MRAGRLNQRITIERVTETRGASGGITRAWATFATVWGRVMPLRGREFYAAQAVQAETDVKVEIRTLEGITEKMRAVVAGQVYDIRAVLVLDRYRTELVCKAGANNG